MAKHRSRSGYLKKYPRRLNSTPAGVQQVDPMEAIVPRWRKELERQKQREVDERFKALFGWRSVR
jgi:hypothetical protein